MCICTHVGTLSQARRSWVGYKGRALCKSTALYGRKEEQLLKATDPGSRCSWQRELYSFLSCHEQSKAGHGSRLRMKEKKNPHISFISILPGLVRGEEA